MKFTTSCSLTTETMTSSRKPLVLKNSTYSSLISSDGYSYFVAGFPARLVIGDLEKNDQGEQVFDHLSLIFPLHTFYPLTKALLKAKKQLKECNHEDFEIVLLKNGSNKLVANMTLYCNAPVFQIR